MLNIPNRKLKPNGRSIILFVGIGSLFFVLGAAFPFKILSSELKLGKGEAPVKIAPDNPALALQNAFINVASSVSPAVVNISSEWTENIRGFNDFGNREDFFNFFFYGPQGPQNRRAPPVYKHKQRSLGSGFLITEDGYALTNAHVIGKADKVTVTLEDGSTYPAKIIGMDEKFDIGIVKIETPKKKFAHAVLGDSDAIQVGQWTVAIGNPFALDHTFTAGVVSAKGRNVAINDDSGLQSYIQTDASINPGNSGGPLCDIQGQVIGINTAIFSQSGGSVGIGFAIPSNIARKVAEDLINTGKVIRAGLGAMVQSLTPKMAKSFGLSATEGALLSNISQGSAAEKAGLKPGDIVLEINGNKVLNSGELVSKLLGYKPGETVQLTILRDGNKAQVPVTLQKLDDGVAKTAEKSTSGGNKSLGQGKNDDLGLVYQDQTPELQDQLPSGTPKGPVITQVDRQGAAAAAGLQRGDVVLKVENTPVYSANQLSVILKKSDLKEGVRLFVWRDGMTLYTLLQTGDE
jgi:serine protease Do